MSKPCFVLVLAIGCLLLCLNSTAQTVTVSATDCNKYSSPEFGVPYERHNIIEHNTGDHYWIDSSFGACTYSGTASASGLVGCSVSGFAQSSAQTFESGALNTAFDEHFVSWNQISQSANANLGSPVITQTEAGFAVESCLVFCGVSIGFTPATGGGFGVTYTPPNPLWPDKNGWKHTCTGVTLAQLPQSSSCASPTSPYPGQSTSNGFFTWNAGSCQWVWVNCPAGVNCSPSASPVVFDTLNKGFAFTDPTKEYVTFDIAGNGVLRKLSWPKAGSGNAWLVYDRDGDGVIKDGTEMFGNFTPHSDFVQPGLDPKYRNGFIALAWYDQSSQGGNGDAMLDKNDSIWNKLRLWIDTHCFQQPGTPCQSRPQELHTLESMGVNSISLVYGYDPGGEDAIGNWFKYWVYVNPDISNQPIDPSDGKHRNPHTHEGCCKEHQTSSHDGRKAYDVFLASAD